MRFASFLLVVLVSSSLFAQHLIPQPVFDTISAEFSGEAAQEYDRQIVQYHRIQGSPMMAEVAEKVALAKLQAWGIESKIEQFPSDGKTRYQTHVSPMGWDMRGGELWIEGIAGNAHFTPLRLCRYSDVPMCVSTYSKGGDWSGELVEVGAGTSDTDYAGKDVRGKVALAYGYAGMVVREAALKHGAIGVVIYPPPGDRPDHPDMVRYNGIWPRAEELDKTVGGFQISANQYTMLQVLMRRGPVKVHGKINATLEPYKLTLVHAWIRGSQNPEQEIIITGHLDHPKWSANDNASGSATMLEAVRTLHALIAAGKLPAPLVSIHFMWVPEFFGTMAYVTKHPEARGCNAGWDDPRQSPPNKPYKAGDPCILFNLNLDMTGEDTVKTNSRFYITRTPDSVPGYLDGVMADVLQQTREANLFAPTGSRNYWPAEMAPYMQGSDHDVFLALGISSTMLGHDPDWTHHSSEDTVDKTDASEFRRVGVLAAASAYWLANDTPENQKRIADVGRAEIIATRSRRLGQALALGGSKKRLQTDTDSLAAAMQQQSIQFQFNPTPSKASAGPAPRRLTVLPLYETAINNISPEDKKWWDAQDAIFASEAPGGGEPTSPPFGMIVYEAMNFMDGKRTTSDIADLLSAEYNHDFDDAWMDQLVRVLERLKLVSTK